MLKKVVPRQMTQLRNDHFQVLSESCGFRILKIFTMLIISTLFTISTLLMLSTILMIHSIVEICTIHFVSTTLMISIDVHRLKDIHCLYDPHVLCEVWRSHTDLCFVRVAHYLNEFDVLLAFMLSMNFANSMRFTLLCIDRGYRGLVEGRHGNAGATIGVSTLA